MIRKLLSFVFLNFFLISAYSQTNNAPIPFEFFVGNNRTNVQLNVNKNIASKFNFSNLTIAAADYENNLSETEVIMMNSIVYQFHKNINIGTGLQYHFKKGIVPNISMSFSYLNPTWTFLLIPYLDFIPKLDFEFVGVIEFKPKLTKTIRLYTRIQGLYSHNITDNLHDRSFANFRLGLKIKKIAFGGASNIDYYSPKKIYKDNYGAFIKIDM